MNMDNKALILFAHGARDPLWAAPFEAVATQVQALRPHVQVRLAYLDFMSPTLPEAVAEMAGAGCLDVSVVPLFLGSGGHVRKDLPLIIDQLRSQHPHISLTLQGAAGEHPAVIAAIASVAAAAV
ncbi:MAG TPA: CbiX/SirB N-terminal domain-containing protein [Rubrivivax sp.]|nr:CbiX/SirB N-terminal domain-containing protein [Rubrivivax sp.]